MASRLVFRAAGIVHRTLYRLTGGAVGGSMWGARVLLLTTTGRKSGKRRTTPLLYLEDDGDLLVVASKGGSPTHPAWFLNLRDDPQVEVEVGRDRRELRARIAGPEERERLWSKVVGLYPAYADYQRRTRREIPVVVLERIRPAEG